MSESELDVIIVCGPKWEFASIIINVCTILDHGKALVWPFQCNNFNVNSKSLIPCSIEVVRISLFGLALLEHANSYDLESPGTSCVSSK